MLANASFSGMAFGEKENVKNVQCSRNGQRRQKGQV
jgi:hypothetical protein